MDEGDDQELENKSQSNFSSCRIRFLLFSFVLNLGQAVIVRRVKYRTLIT